MTRVPPVRTLSSGPLVAGDPARRARHQALREEVHHGIRDLSVNVRHLALLPELDALFGSRGLRCGNTVLIGGALGQGMTSLAFGLCAGPTRDGRWVGMLNLSRAGLLSATELGVALEHLVVIPHPVERVAGTASILMEACSLVLLGSDQPVSAHDARRLQRRAREHHCVLVVLASPIATRSRSARSVAGQRCWPEVPDTLIEVTRSTSVGIGHGDGHLLGRQLCVEVTHRRTGLEREVYELTLPVDAVQFPPNEQRHSSVHVGLHDVVRQGNDRSLDDQRAVESDAVESDAVGAGGVGLHGVG